jgi:hypothetical protein
MNMSLASTQQGAGLRRVQHFVQQKGPRGSRTFLLAPATSSTALTSGLFGLSKTLRATLEYEHGLVFAEGDDVIVHREK